MSGLNYRLIQPPAVEPVSLARAKQQCRVDIPDDNELIQDYISAAREYCENWTNRAFFTQTWQLSLDSFPYGDYRTTIPQEQRAPWNFSAYWNDLAIRLPRPRLLAVTSFTYLDANLQQQSLALNTDYLQDATSQPARLTPVAAATWPITQFYVPGSIQIEYTAGSFINPSFSETLQVVGTGAPYTTQLTKLNLGITSVKDGSGNPVTGYTTAPLLNANQDDQGITELQFPTAPAGNTVTVTYSAGVIPPAIKIAMLLIISHLYEHREENTEVALKSVPLGAHSFMRRYKFKTFGNYQSGY